MQDQQSQPLAVIQAALSELTNVEPGDIKRSDHLEESLFLDIDVDLPRLIVKIGQDLDLEISKETINDFLNEIDREPEKATVAELEAMFTEEMEFN